MLTNSRIRHGNQLGTQTMTASNLLYLVEINNQELVF